MKVFILMTMLLFGINSYPATLESISGSYVAANSSTSCETSELFVNVDGNDVEIRAIGRSSFNGQAYDVTDRFKGVNTENYETILYVNAVTEIKRTIFIEGTLKTQTKKRSDVFPVPWALLSWQDNRSELTVLGNNEVLYGPSIADCKMVRK